MTSPYINTVLKASVSIFPSQMNNDIKINIKRNLCQKLEKKCYRNYGYITKIYKVLDISGGYIDPENNMSIANYDVTFSCRLCMPLKNTTLTCRVGQTNQILTRLVNGPIIIIITHDRINKTIFSTSKFGIVVKKENAEPKQLVAGDYVQIRFNSRKFNDKDDIIMGMGILEDISSEKEIKTFQQDENIITDKFIDYDKYISLEEQGLEIDEFAKTIEDIELKGIAKISDKTEKK